LSLKLAAIVVIRTIDVVTLLFAQYERKFIAWTWV
jgi:hypothetical protein